MMATMGTARTLDGCRVGSPIPPAHRRPSPRTARAAAGRWGRPRLHGATMPRALRRGWHREARGERAPHPSYARCEERTSKARRGACHPVSGAITGRLRAVERVLHVFRLFGGIWPYAKAAAPRGVGLPRRQLPVFTRLNTARVCPRTRTPSKPPPAHYCVASPMMPALSGSPCRKVGR